MSPGIAGGQRCSLGMVEGPQCALKTKRLAVLQGQRLLAVVGCPKCIHAGTVGAQVLRVYNVGKECFVVFATRALRLHFAMAGNMEIIPASSSPAPMVGRRKHTVTLQFSEQHVVLWDSTATNVTLGYTERWAARAGRDIIAEDFDLDGVLALLVARGEEAVAEAIMDQEVAPGVGNVIKCEGLHAAAINPAALCFELSRSQLQLLVQALRDFAMYWYECCAKSKSAQKQIYSKERCMRCDGAVTLLRLQTNSRITYFCASCQPICTSADAPPSTNKQIGWQPLKKPGKRSAATAAHTLHDCWRAAPTVEGTPWSCTRCTYANLAGATSCSMCAASQPSAAALSPAVRDRIEQQRAAAQARLLAKRVKTSPATAAAQTKAEISNLPTPESSSAITRPVCSCKLKSDRPSNATLQRVRKAGPNQGRLFWSCSGRMKGCGFFSWADDAFPKCKHGKVAVLRMVLKPGANNGKVFFSCSAGKDDQCGLFEWTTTDLGVRIPL